MKKGPKETALQAMREAACKIDHDDSGLPKFLCVKCNPRKTETGTAATTVPQETKRDFRIPKGMSTEEGNVMLAERAAKKAEMTKQAIESLTTKQRDELARINALRETNGLPALPEKYQRQMKSDQAANELLFARAELNPKPKAKMESKMNTTTETTTPVKKKAPAKKAAAKKKPAAKKAAPTTKKSNGKSKVDVVAELLKRAQGCTTADVLKATGWPSVSMPKQAKAAGLKLRKEKKPGELTRYFGS